MKSLKHAQVHRWFPRLGRSKAAFTLVELLVVIAVIGVLVALLLPVIQTTRETARRMECINHLKQLSMACVNHESAEGHFPTGGWSGTQLWIGDPDCGYGRKQPGGWTYNILPFIENKALHDRGTGMSAAQKRNVLAGTAQTVLGVYYCPTRRQPMLYPNAHFTGGNIDYIASGARTDYAANSGTPIAHGDPEGPISVTGSEDGIIFARSQILIKDIRDGTSHTYLLGEKYLTSDHYKDGMSNGDRLPLYANYAVDWQRNANSSPDRDRPGFDDVNIFGSAHRAGFNMSFCDGSVRTVSYDIDLAAHRHFGSRNDGF